jgi:hypothetical protein
MASELLEGLSQEPRARLQGKSCFNILLSTRLKEAVFTDSIP